MYQEVIDPNSGAILFKKTEEARNLDEAISAISELKERCNRLESRVKELEDKIKD